MTLDLQVFLTCSSMTHLHPIFLRLADTCLTSSLEQLLSQEWEIKPRKGRQRKTWSRTIDDTFHSLSLYKGEILDDMHEGNSSLEVFYDFFRG